MKPFIFVAIFVCIAVCAIGYPIWYWNTDPSPRPNQIQLPAELRKPTPKTVSELQVGEEIETGFTAMVVDSHGYCWIKFHSEEYKSTFWQLKIKRTTDGFAVQINKDFGERWELNTPGMLRLWKLGPVVNLEVVEPKRAP